jgi:hypothetical protein
MNDAQIKHMVDRFLAWKLPDNFSPDAGVGMVWSIIATAIGGLNLGFVAGCVWCDWARTNRADEPETWTGAE